MREKRYSYIQYDGNNTDDIKSFLDSIGVNYSIKYFETSHLITINYRQSTINKKTIKVNISDYLCYDKDIKYLFSSIEKEFKWSPIPYIFSGMKDCNRHIDSSMLPFSVGECLSMIEQNILPSVPCYSNGYAIKKANNNIRIAFEAYNKINK